MTDYEVSNFIFLLKNFNFLIADIIFIYIWKEPEKI